MNPIFTVIIPLYNTAEYLHQTIGSIISQSFGFRENIQIILVNDGSTDETESICLEYKSTYPDNIDYISQENAGVSAARNAGIPYIRGKYTNFMDADDLWDERAFALAFEMLENHVNEIDVVSCRMDLFEGKTGYPPLDFKFRGGDFICDIFEHPSYGQFSVCSCFIRTDAIEDFRYDIRLTYGEDAKFINQIILKKEKYGILKSALYHVRKRIQNSSLTQGKLSRPTAYLDTATYYYKYLADTSVQKYGQVIPYIQYAIINAIKYRVGYTIPDSIPSDIREKYIELLTEMISDIDDEVICQTNNVGTPRKVYLLIQKYGTDALREITDVKDGALYVHGIKIGPAFVKKSIQIDKAESSLFKTVIYGTVNCPLLTEGISLHVKAGKKMYACEVSPAPEKSSFSYKNEAINKVYDFRVAFNSLKNKKLEDLEWIPQLLI